MRSSRCWRAAGVRCAPTCGRSRRRCWEATDVEHEPPRRPGPFAAVDPPAAGAAARGVRGRTRALARRAARVGPAAPRTIGRGPHAVDGSRRPRPPARCRAVRAPVIRAGRAGAGSGPAPEARAALAASARRRSSPGRRGRGARLARSRSPATAARRRRPGARRRIHESDRRAARALRGRRVGYRAVGGLCRLGARLSRRAGHRHTLLPATAEEVSGMTSGGRAALVAILLTWIAPAHAEMGPGMGRPFGPPPFLAQLFPPKLVMEHQQEIGLTPAQMDAIKQAMSDAQQKLVDLQWRLEAESEALGKLLAGDHVDESAVLAKLAEVTAIEQQVKKVNFTLLVRI